MICTWQKLCKGLQKRLKIDRRKEGKKQNESKETDRTKLKKKNCPPIYPCRRGGVYFELQSLHHVSQKNLEWRLNGFGRCPPSSGLRHAGGGRGGQSYTCKLHRLAIFTGDNVLYATRKRAPVE